MVEGLVASETLVAGCVGKVFSFSSKLLLYTVVASTRQAPHTIAIFQTFFTKNFNMTKNKVVFEISNFKNVNRKQKQKIEISDPNNLIVLNHRKVSNSTYG